MVRVLVMSWCLRWLRRKHPEMFDPKAASEQVRLALLDNR